MLKHILYLRRRLTLLSQIPWVEYGVKLRTIAKVKPYTMMSWLRLASLYDLAKEIGKNEVEGCVVECGVWNGGSGAMLGSVSRLFGTDRDLWLFDSFAGLPEPTGHDVAITGKKGKAGAARGSESLVKEVCFKVMRLFPSKVHIVKGWFQNTIPNVSPQIGSIAVLHLDCDWYESVTYCLDALYDKVVKGGIVVVDDYGYFQGCKKAVDEFLQKKRIPACVVKTEESAVYFRKV